MKIREPIKRFKDRVKGATKKAWGDTKCFFGIHKKVLYESMTRGLYTECKRCGVRDFDVEDPELKEPND